MLTAPVPPRKTVKREEQAGGTAQNAHTAVAMARSPPLSVLVAALLMAPVSHLSAASPTPVMDSTDDRDQCHVVGTRRLAVDTATRPLVVPPAARRAPSLATATVRRAAAAEAPAATMQPLRAVWLPRWRRPACPVGTCVGRVLAVGSLPSMAPMVSMALAPSLRRSPVSRAPLSVDMYVTLPLRSTLWVPWCDPRTCTVQYAILPGNNSRLLKVCFRDRVGWASTSRQKPTDGYHFMYDLHAPCLRRSVLHRAN